MTEQRRVGHERADGRSSAGDPEVVVEALPGTDVRRSGVVESPTALGCSGHLCWTYDDRTDFLSSALSFLGEGVQLGQRVLLVGASSRGSLLDQIAALPRGDDLVAVGAADVVSLVDMYESFRFLDPRRQVDAYVAETEASLDAGYTGLRVAAEATPLVRTRAQRDMFRRYEHLVDAYAVSHPFAAMCAYDRHELGDEAIAELACLHPVTRYGASPFRLFAGEADTLALSGDIDAFTQQLFESALEVTLSARAGDRVVIDCSELVFMDHHGLEALNRSAHASATHIVLRGAAPVVGRLASLLRTDRVHVDDPG